LKNAAEGEHIPAPVQDADHHLLFGKTVGNVAQA